jgi:hypothetical protein
MGTTRKYSFLENFSSLFIATRSALLVLLDFFMISDTRKTRW